MTDETTGSAGWLQAGRLLAANRRAVRYLDAVLKAHEHELTRGELADVEAARHTLIEAEETP